MINLDVLKRMPNDMKLEDAINILDVAKLVGEDFWYHHDNKWRSLIQPTELMEKISDNQIVNVYAVTRRYGGPEEGGWWYDQHQHIAAFKFDDNKIRRPMIEELFKEKSRHNNQYCPKNYKSNLGYAVPE